MEVCILQASDERPRGLCTSAAPLNPELWDAFAPLALPAKGGRDLEG